MVKDQATLTGPYKAGDVIEFWAQTTPFENPDAARDKLACVAPDPADMKGAWSIGRVTVDHDIDAGKTETIWSPQFTWRAAGCTNIKEVATRYRGKDAGALVLAQGYFGAPGEVTRWQGKGPGGHPSTGTSAAAATAASLGLLLLGGTALRASRRRTRRPAHRR
jgi:hypothetical protein